MAKKKGKYEKKLGPPPGIGKMPNVNIDTGIGKVEADLAKARKAGKQAAKGQLGTISKQVGGKLGKQEARFDVQSRRVLDNMRRLNTQSKLFISSRRGGIGATQQGYMASPLGARAAGLTGARSRSLSGLSDVAKSVTSGALQQGRTTRKAGQAALDANYGIEKSANKSSLSILDVLAAQRSGDDALAIAEMEQQERMMELQMAHDIRMDRMNFKQDIYSTKLANALQKDYTQWQYDQGYLETPDETRRQDYKYEAMGKRLDAKLAAKATDPETFSAFNHGADVAETVTTQAVEVMNSPEFENKWREVKASIPADGDVPMTDAQAKAYTVQRMVAFTPAEDDPYASAIASNVVQSVVQNGAPPSYDEIQSIISQADSTGKVADYINKNPEMATNLQRDWRALDLVVEGDAQASLDAAGGRDPLTETPWGEIGKSVGAVGAAGAGLYAIGASRKGRAAAALGGNKVGRVEGFKIGTAPARNAAGQVYTKIDDAARGYPGSVEAAKVVASKGRDLADTLVGTVRSKARRANINPFSRMGDSGAEVAREIMTEAEAAESAFMKGAATPDEMAQLRAVALDKARQGGRPAAPAARAAAPAADVMTEAERIEAAFMRGDITADEMAQNRAVALDKARSGAGPVGSVDEINDARTARWADVLASEAGTLDADQSIGFKTFNAAQAELDYMAAQEAGEYSGSKKWLKFEDGTVSPAIGDASESVLSKFRAKVISASEAAKASKFGPVMRVAGSTLKAVGRFSPALVAGEAIAGQDLPFWESPARTAGARTDIPGAEDILDARRFAEQAQHDVQLAIQNGNIAAAQRLHEGEMDPREYLDFIKANTIDLEYGDFDEDAKWELFQQGVRQLRAYYERNGA